LLEDRLRRSYRQIGFRVRNGYFARLGWMLELMVAASDIMDMPAVLFQQPDDFRAPHVCIIHTKRMDVNIAGSSEIFSAQIVE